MCFFSSAIKWNFTKVRGLWGVGDQLPPATALAHMGSGQEGQPQPLAGGHTHGAPQFRHCLSTVPH